MKNNYLSIIKILIISVFAYLFLEQNKSANSDNQFDQEIFFDTLIEEGLIFSQDFFNESLSDQRMIVVTSAVNAHFSRYVISQLLLFNKTSNSTPIDIYIRTEGGWEGDAFAIIDTMRSIEAPVNIHAIGEVHSSGLMILAAATGKRIVYPYTMLGFHALDEDEGKIYEERYLNLWKELANLPQEWLDRRDYEMLYFTPEQALEYKVADILISKPQI